VSPLELPEGLVYEPEFLSEEEEAELVAELEGPGFRRGDAPDWEHSISPTKALRYSLTFRTLQRP
jgi:hypothetical protein